MKCKKLLFITLTALLLLLIIALTACTEKIQTTAQANEKIKTFTIGAIQPLTGDASVHGQAMKKTIQKAVENINKEWQNKNQKLEVIFEDGKCNPKDSLTAAESLDFKGINIIYGGLCSGETLGIAPFAEKNKMLVFSPASSSPEITKSGDYIFRNAPSDSSQVDAMVDFLEKEHYKRHYKSIALLSENTDYAQALRKSYADQLPRKNIKIAADEIVLPNAKDVRTQLAKIKSKDPDAIIFLPQTPKTMEVFLKQYTELGFDIQGLGNDVMIASLEGYEKELESFIFPKASFTKESDAAFQQLQEKTNCASLGYYCATTYDGIFLLAELLEQCGENPDCIKEKLYQTKNWRGKFAEEISFDQNGDVNGNYNIFQVKNGEAVLV